MEDNKFNFEVVREDLYKFIDPNITTKKNSIVYFNSDNTEKNDYPQALINRYLQSSSIHSNFINLKRSLTFASGLMPVNEEDTALIDFINKPNMFGDDNNDVYMKMCLDYAIQEMAAIQIIYSADGKISQILHLDISKLRAEQPNNLGQTEAWWFSKDWSKVKGNLSMNDKRIKNPKAVRIPVFNPAKFKEEPRQVMILKRYTTGNPTYSIPSYNSALNAVDTDFEIGQFSYNNINNGFLPSAIISLIGQPDSETKRKFINDFNSTQTGTGNIKALFMWLDNMDDKPSFERMAADPNAKLFDVLKQQILQDIAIGHGAGLELAGVATGGADLGGDANKLNVTRLSFIENVIVDFQRVLLKGINNLYRFNFPETEGVAVVNEPLKLTQPIASADDLTRDERRDLLYGLPPLENNNTDETINE